LLWYNSDDYCMNRILEELHFITLNYILDYILFYKLFECTFYTLNYDYCYILHPNIKFAIKLNGKI